MSYIYLYEKVEDGSPMTGIPIDVAAMIVVGAIVSIGLTAVAALMIFHVRSRLLKAALSIYSQEKVERQQFPQKDSVVSATTTATGNGLDVTIGTLPRTTLYTKIIIISLFCINVFLK